MLCRGKIILRIMEFSFHDFTNKGMLFMAQLDEYFTRHLSVPTMPIDPIAALNLDINQEIPNTRRPGLGTVLGLGLREV